MSIKKGDRFKVKLGRCVFTAVVTSDVTSTDRYVATQLLDRRGKVAIYAAGIPVERMTEENRV